MAISNIDLVKAELALWKGIARSRERHNDFLSAYGDLMAEIAEFWRTAAPEGAELPPEIVAKVDQFQSRT